MEKAVTSKWKETITWKINKISTWLHPESIHRQGSIQIRTWAVLGHLCVTQAQRPLVSFPQIPEKSCLVNKRSPRGTRGTQVSQTNPLQCWGDGDQGHKPRALGFGSTDTVRTGPGTQAFSPSAKYDHGGAFSSFKSSSESCSCSNLQRKVYFAGKAAC